MGEGIPVDNMGDCGRGDSCGKYGVTVEEGVPVENMG